MAQGAMHQPGDRAHITYEDFLDWADEDTLAEWVDGKIIFMSPISLAHANLNLFLVRLISDHVERHRLGQVCCESVRYQEPATGWRMVKSCDATALRRRRENSQ